MFKKYIAIGLKVTDFRKAFDFYTKVLELKVKSEDQENEFAELRIGVLVIALLTKETLNNMCDKSNFAESQSSNHLIAVEVDDLQKAFKRLKGKVDFVQEPKTTPWGQKVAYFEDIEGYIWEISEQFEEE